MIKSTVAQISILIVSIMGAGIAGYKLQAYQQEAKYKAFFDIGHKDSKAVSPQDFFDIGKSSTKSEK